MAVLIGFNKSVVLSTFPKPTIDLEIPPTVPVNVGEANGAIKAKEVLTSEEFAFKSNAVWVAVLIGFNKSVVLSTLPKPTIDLEIPPTVPVNVGEAKGAINAKEVLTSAVFAFRDNPGTVGAVAVPPKSPAN